MTRPSLKSRFGEQIRAFVGYKNSLGFPYDESIRILGRFDDFCVERFPEKDCLDRELALAWLEKRDTENTAGHRNRIMVIREFAKYLRAVGTEAYMIPISMTSKGPRYVPHMRSAWDASILSCAHPEKSALFASKRWASGTRQKPSRRASYIHKATTLMWKIHQQSNMAVCTAGRSPIAS